MVNANAETNGGDFSAFWNKFKAAVVSGNKSDVADMTKFPLSMPYGVKAIKNKEDLSHRYAEVFNGEASAAKCFEKATPQQESTERFNVYCPFKKTPNDWDNAPIGFIFERTKTGWKFVGMDNINE